MLFGGDGKQEMKDTILNLGATSSLLRKSLVMATTMLLLTGCEYFRPGASPLRSSSEQPPPPEASWPIAPIVDPIYGGFTL